MQPFSRETITDRRQPSVRWSAVLAGAVLAAGLWMLLQLLFTGGALSAIDPDEVGNVREFSIGTTIGSVLAPLLAMLVGGWLAGRLAGHYDRRVAGLHGALVWALTAVVGLVFTANAVSKLASPMAASEQMVTPAPGARAYVAQAVDQVNAQLKQKNAPTITTNDLIDASQHASAGGGAINREAFIARLDEKTGLSRAEAEGVVASMGDATPDVVGAASQLALYRQVALEAAENAGKALLAAGVGLLLCLVLAVGGAMLAARQLDRRNRGEGNRAEAVPAAGNVTAPYPTTTPTDPYQKAATDVYPGRDPNT